MRAAGTTSQPMNAYEELLELTVAVANHFQLSPFDVFKQDNTQVLMLMDYLLLQGIKKEAQPLPYNPPQVENGGGYSDPIWNYL